MLLAIRRGNVKMVGLLHRYGMVMSGMRCVIAAIGSRSDEMINLIIDRYRPKIDIIRLVIRFGDPHAIDLFIKSGRYKKCMNCKRVFIAMLETDNPEIIRMVLPHVYGQWNTHLIQGISLRMSPATFITLHDTLEDSGIDCDDLIKLIGHGGELYQDTIDILINRD